jgi:hypothetical protein
MVELYLQSLIRLHEVRFNYVRFEVSMAVTIKNAVLWDVTQRGSCTDVSEECRASIIRVTRMGELGTTVSSN